MNITPENKKKLTRWIIGICAACILIFLGAQNIDVVADALSWLAGIAMPLIIGAAIALILNVPMRFLEERLWIKSKKTFWCKARRPIAFILAFVLIVGILFGVVMIILPTLIETVKVIVQSAIDIVNRFNSMSKEEIAELPFGQILLDIDWTHLVDSLKSWLRNQANGIVNTLFGTVTSFVAVIIDLFVSVAFAIYLLFSKETLKKQAKRIVKAWIPAKKADWLIHAFSVANVNFKSFISGQFLEAVILGVLCFIGMIVFRFPYAAMISTMVGVTALVPVIGGFIGGGIGAFMILTVEPIKALWFVVYLVVLQQLEGNIIYPRVMGNRVNLSAMWILAAVTIGGGIGGPVGMLLGVPLASTFAILFNEATQKRELALESQVVTPDTPTPNDNRADDSAPLNNISEPADSNAASSEKAKPKATKKQPRKPKKQTSKKG